MAGVVIQPQHFPLAPLPGVEFKATPPVPGGFQKISGCLAACGDGPLLNYSAQRKDDNAWAEPALHDEIPFTDALGQLDYRIRAKYGSTVFTLRKSLLMAHWFMLYGMTVDQRRALLPGDVFMYDMAARDGTVKNMRWARSGTPGKFDMRKSETLAMPIGLAPLLRAHEQVHGRFIPMMRPDVPEHYITRFPRGLTGRGVLVAPWVTAARVLSLIPRLPEAYQEAGEVLDELFYMDMLKYTELEDLYRAR